MVCHLHVPETIRWELELAQQHHHLLVADQSQAVARLAIGHHGTCGKVGRLQLADQLEVQLVGNVVAHERRRNVYRRERYQQRQRTTVSESRHGVELAQCYCTEWVSE